jgi:hypothetical protein
MASNEWYEENGDFYEDETDAYIEDGDYEAENYESAAEADERDYIDGGSDGLNHNTASADKSFMAYFIIAGVLGAFIAVAVWRKRVRTNAGSHRSTTLFGFIVSNTILPNPNPNRNNSTVAILAKN